jgi:hypothetical protein
MLAAVCVPAARQAAQQAHASLDLSRQFQVMVISQQRAVESLRVLIDELHRFSSRELLRVMASSRMRPKKLIVRGGHR